MVTSTVQGFIFVNELGHYATAPRMSFDHGPRREVIGWTANINEAHVYLHEAMVRRCFKELEKAQSLKAVVTREVMLMNWSED